MRGTKTCLNRCMAATACYSKRKALDIGEETFGQCVCFINLSFRHLLLDMSLGKISAGGSLGDRVRSGYIGMSASRFQEIWLRSFY